MIERVRRRPILLAPVGLVAVAAVIVAPLVALRFAQGGDGLRLDLWRSALTILAAHPVLGGGPGTWVQLKVEAAPAGSPNLILPHAHDLYVQAAAELGLVGLAALAVLAMVVANRLLVGIRSGGPDVHALAVTVGLVAFLGQSLVDNLVNLPFVCLMVLGIVAWVDGGLTAGEEAAEVAVDPSRLVDPARVPEAARVAPLARTPAGQSSRGRLRLPVMVAMLLAMIVALPTIIRIDRAAAAQAPGNVVIDSDPARALAAYEAALVLDPDFTLYAIQRAAALARLGRTAEARQQLAEAVTLDPVGTNLISLASLDLASGDGATALAHVRQALERAPGDLTVILNAGLIAARLGERQLALEQLAAAVVLRPAIAGLPLFDDPAGVVSKGAVVARARQMVGPQPGALILAYAGDPATARRELEAQPASSGRDILVAATTWLGGDLDGAVTRLQAMVEANPLDYVAAGWLAGILRASDDPRAGDYARLSRLIQADAWPGIAQEITARIAGPDEGGYGLPANYPWAVYLRGFGDLLAPGITVIAPGS